MGLCMNDSSQDTCQFALPNMIEIFIFIVWASPILSEAKQDRHWTVFRWEITKQYQGHDTKVDNGELPMIFLP